jgi:hypothetical protein
MQHNQSTLHRSHRSTHPMRSQSLADRGGEKELNLFGERSNRSRSFVFAAENTQALAPTKRCRYLLELSYSSQEHHSQTLTAF